MPNYYNPYNFYPVSYQPNGYVNPQNTQQQIFTNGPKMMEWVDGEVGAKAFPMPTMRLRLRLLSSILLLFRVLPILCRIRIAAGRQTLAAGAALYDFYR